MDTAIFLTPIFKFRKVANVLQWYCSASELRHLHFMTILKSFYCPVAAYMYILLLKEAIPFT